LQIVSRKEKNKVSDYLGASSVAPIYQNVFGNENNLNLKGLFHTGLDVASFATTDMLRKAYAMWCHTYLHYNYALCVKSHVDICCDLYREL